MSDVSQGPGWWLASDGKWYPPHTAPQATLPPDAGAAYPGYAQPQPTTPSFDQGVPAQAYTQPGTEAYADLYAPSPGAYQQPGSPYQAVPGVPGAGYAAYPPSSASPEATAPQPVVAAAAPGTGAAMVADTVASPAASSAPSQTMTSTRRPHWQPWLALAGIALVVWGAGQGVLAWSEWHVVQAQLSTFGTVLQGHVGMVLQAAGPVVAGIAAVAIALTLDRR